MPNVKKPWAKTNKVNTHMERYQSQGMMICRSFLSCTEYFHFLRANGDKSHWNAYIVCSRAIHKFEQDCSKSRCCELNYRWNRVSSMMCEKRRMQKVSHMYYSNWWCGIPTKLNKWRALE